MIDPTKSAGPTVVKIGGTALEKQSSEPELWRALLALHHAGGLVLVHGGGKAVDAHLDRLGFTTERKEGIRITPAEQIDEIAAVLAGRVNKSLVGTINAHGGRAVGLCLGDGGAIETRKTTRYAFDPGMVGDVTGGKGRLLRLLLADGYLPVMSSIGLDEGGRFLNVNADDAAAGVAKAIGAKRLVLLTDVPGILGGDGKVIPEVNAAAIEALIETGVVKGGMIPKVRAALAAAESTRAPVTVLNGNDPGMVVAWAGGAAAGTRIVP